MSRKQLIEVFQDPFTSGIFNALQSMNVPWKNKNISDVLDLNYFGNFSGMKYVTPLISLLLGNNTFLTNQSITKLANIIYNTYIDKWNRYYEIYNLDIEYIDTKTETEEMKRYNKGLTHGKSIQRTDNLTLTNNLTDRNTKDLTDTDTKNLTDTDTKNLTNQVTLNTTNTVINDVSAYNVTTFSDANKATTTNTGTETTTQTGTDTNNHMGTDTITHTGTDTDTHTGTQTNTGTQTTTNSGTDNETITYLKEKTYTDDIISNVKDNFDFWNWDFFEIVFSDIDKILTICIY